jgi:hypothetical protein
MASGRLRVARAESALAAALVVAVAVAASDVTRPRPAPAPHQEYEVETPEDEYHEGEEHADAEGRVPRKPRSTRPTVIATFTRESYPPDSAAGLLISDRARSVSVQIYRAGLEDEEQRANDVHGGRGRRRAGPRR